MTWLFPTTLFLLAFLVWIGGLLMVQSQHRNILTICCTILASLSVVLLLQAQAIAAAGILICIMLFSTILYFGFDLPWEKEKIPTGPLSSFLHQEGIAITYLEPKGQVQIQDKILPAIMYDSKRQQSQGDSLWTKNFSC